MKEQILKEFENKYSKDFEIKSEPHNYIHKGLNPSFNMSDVKKFLSQAIDQTREETIKEVEYNLPLEYHPDGDSEKGYNACLSEIKIKLNKLKK